MGRAGPNQNSLNWHGDKAPTMLRTIVGAAAGHGGLLGVGAGVLIDGTTSERRIAGLASLGRTPMGAVDPIGFRQGLTGTMTASR